MAHLEQPNINQLANDTLVIILAGGQVSLLNNVCNYSDSSLLS
jgi:hypothetical protein